MNYIYFEVRDEITHARPNFNRAAAEFCEWISIFIPHFTDMW